MGCNSIHWFRKGLRLHDNPALLESVQGVGTIRCVYIVDPWFAGTSSLAINRWGWVHVAGRPARRAIALPWRLAPARAPLSQPEAPPPPPTAALPHPVPNRSPTSVRPQPLHLTAGPSRSSPPRFALHPAPQHRFLPPALSVKSPPSRESRRSIVKTREAVYDWCLFIIVFSDFLFKLRCREDLLNMYNCDHHKFRGCWQPGTKAHGCKFSSPSLSPQTPSDPSIGTFI